MIRPFFSIITVTLNSGDSLQKTVKSVAQQTYSNYEHLIKDGGSIDNSIESNVLNSKQRIISQPDSGIYDAMNQALEICSGKYILFLNAGDTLYNNEILQIVSNQLKKNKTDILYGFIEDNGIIITYPKVLTKLYMYRNSVCHQAWFLSRKSYKLCNGFDLKFKVLADHNILLNLIIKHKISHQLIMKPLVSIAPMGFSSVQNDLKVSERKFLMRWYFCNKNDHLMVLFYAMTFPGIRIWMSKNRFTRKFYSIIKNIFN